MVSTFNARNDLFNELVQLAIGSIEKYSWRAAWLLCSCMNAGDVRVQKYTADIIQVIPHRKDGHQRELLHVLNKLGVNEDTEGQLFDLCLSLWEQINKKPSVRYTAFRIILDIVKKYPEMSKEISFLMQPQYLETLSPGIKRAALMRYEEVV